MTAEKRTVSLVLGSGGARGLAHIGVIHYLEESGYDIRSIAGCSMGAAVGGIYAAGKLDDFEKWVCAIDRMDIVSLLDLSWQKDGLVKGDKIIETLKKLIGDRDIEDLPIPFTAVAADFAAEKEIWMQKGSLFNAIRASISLPLFFTPVEYNGRRLIDGGVLNPVPIAPTFSDHNDMTIAVNVGGKVERSNGGVQQNDPPEKKPAEEAEEAEEDEETSNMRKAVHKFMKSLGSRFSREKPEELDVLEIANQAFDAMQSAISRHKLAAYPPDRVVTIPRDAATIMEFDRASELIELGYEAAKEQLGEGG